MAAVISNNVEEEYMWSCCLDKDNKEVLWLPEEPVKEGEDEKEDLKPGHRLLIKNAILMPGVEKDAVHVVQIECEGYNSKKVSFFIKIKLWVVKWSPIQKNSTLIYFYHFIFTKNDRFRHF